jgi:3-hydroxyacyl-[acyl-carrier-protein] dehydratase
VSGGPDAAAGAVPLDRAAIEAILPHRDPMLLLDEVLELVPGERVVARRTVTEADCAGHFPGNPIMPGVKMVEALAQCGAVAVLSQPENAGKLALFAGIDNVRFKRIVRPGETLTLECVVETVRGPVGRGRARATVDGKLAVRGTLTFAVEERDDDGVDSAEPSSSGGAGFAGAGAEN